MELANLLPSKNDVWSFDSNKRNCKNNGQDILKTLLKKATLPWLYGSEILYSDLSVLQNLKILSGVYGLGIFKTKKRKLMKL